MTIADLEKLAKKGDELAKTLVTHYEYPLDIMFLTPDGQLITKLKSFKDFRAAHPDVTYGRDFGLERGGPSHVDVFLNCVAAHFGED